MNNNSWFKKENPFQTVIGLGGGATGFSVYSSSATKTYVDDVFSNYVYVGNESTKTITNGLDNSTEGGLVWTKCRDGSSDMHHILFDTERGVTKDLLSSAAGGEGVSTTMVTAFNENGYTLGSSGYVNENNSDYVSWNFRKAPGFFDIVTWTGNGSSQAISHSLKSVPGCILVKNLSSSIDWAVWHKASAESDATNTLILNTTGAESTNNTYFDDGSTPPTATQFTVHGSNRVNASGSEYIAYVFAGGASTAATARSVDFPNGTNLTIPDDNAWNLGQTFTIEAWVRPDNLDRSYNTVVSQSDGEDNWYMSILSSGKCQFHNFNGTGGTLNSLSGVIQTKQWTHIAFVCNSGTGQWYINGTASGSTATYNVTGGAGGLKIAQQGSHGYNYDGKISNLRIVNGTAVYTSSFVPPTEPLTNVTNTVLLCCNNSSVTGSTVTPATISSSSTPTASDLSPFDDPEGFKFGEEGDQNLIKVGGYLGNASHTGPVVDLGWEPQLVITKQLTSGSPWMMFDVKRDILTGGNDALISANSNLNETNSTPYLQVTPTGFEIVDDGSDINESYETYAYIAIRRSAGLVAKPAEAGTDVFNVDKGNSSTIGPAFDANFAVDMGIKRDYTTTNDWGTHFRLTGPKDLRTNTTDVEGNDNAGGVFDYMNGMSKGSHLNTSYQAWMWKRHAGFDVVAYEGDSNSTRIIRHSLGAAPEMIWVKNRDSATNWIVGNHGLDGGTEPWTHYLYLNTTDVEGDYDFFVDKAPTAYSFEVTTGSLNDTNKSYMAMLFKSVTGISKVGYYDGSNSVNTITTGFQPRFLIIKATTSAQHWYVLDTTRGWASGDDKEMKLNMNNAQQDYDLGAPTATGFTLTVDTGWNAAGIKYIYYAHA